MAKKTISLRLENDVIEALDKEVVKLKEVLRIDITRTDLITKFIKLGLEVNK